MKSSRIASYLNLVSESQSYKQLVSEGLGNLQFLAQTGPLFRVFKEYVLAGSSGMASDDLKAGEYSEVLDFTKVSWGKLQPELRKSVGFVAYLNGYPVFASATNRYQSGRARANPGVTVSGFVSAVNWPNVKKAVAPGADSIVISDSDDTQEKSETYDNATAAWKSFERQLNKLSDAIAPSGYLYFVPRWAGKYPGGAKGMAEAPYISVTEPQGKFQLLHARVKSYAEKDFWKPQLDFLKSFNKFLKTFAQEAVWTFKVVKADPVRQGLSGARETFKTDSIPLPGDKGYVGYINQQKHDLKKSLDRFKLNKAALDVVMADVSVLDNPEELAMVLFTGMTLSKEVVNLAGVLYKIKEFSQSNYGWNIPTIKNGVITTQYRIKLEVADEDMKRSVATKAQAASAATRDAVTGVLVPSIWVNAKVEIDSKTGSTKWTIDNIEKGYW